MPERTLEEVGALAYLQGGPAARWFPLLAWGCRTSRISPAGHRPIIRRLAAQTACLGLRLEYQAWRIYRLAGPVCIMLITARYTRFAVYTS